MIRPVQNRPGQIVESRVEQIKRVAAHALDRANFGDEIARLGDQISPRLDFQRELVAEPSSQPAAHLVPKLEIGLQIDIGLRGCDRAPAIRRRR